MAIFDKISCNFPAGFPGEVATVQLDTAVVTAGPGYTAGVGGLTVGRFAWLSSPVPGDVAPYWSNQTLSHKPKAKEAPLGVVLRRRCSVFSPSAGNDVISEGSSVSLANAGDIFVRSETNASVGQLIYANVGSGAAFTQDNDKVPTNGVATPFIVSQGGAAGEIIIISAARGGLSGSAQ